MKLNFKELKRKQKSRVITSEEALEDIVPFEWTEEVLNGDKKVIIGVDLACDNEKVLDYECKLSEAKKRLDKRNLVEVTEENKEEYFKFVVDSIKLNK